MSTPQTPRYGHAPVPMKCVMDMHCIDTVGEFAWSEENGTRYIMLALPRPKPQAPDDYIMNYLPVINGANPPGGKCWGWDGNKDTPTLTPSIHCIGHWHGWVRNGMLVEA